MARVSGCSAGVGQRWGGGRKKEKEREEKEKRKRRYELVSHSPL